MNLTIREMKPEEMCIVAGYFHQATPEYLEVMGVDPTRIPEKKELLERYAHECGQPIEERKVFRVIWKAGELALGCSTVERIVFGQQAYMHLHIFRPEHRNVGQGVACVKESVKLYFETLRLQRIFCEPNAFNVAPNRTLQRAGFKYVKTHMTVPGPMSYHQAVTCWLLEKPSS